MKVNTFSQAQMDLIDLTIYTNYEKVGIELSSKKGTKKSISNYPIANPVTEDSIRKLEGQLRYIGRLHAKRNSYLEILVASAINPLSVSIKTLAITISNYRDVTDEIDYYLNFKCGNILEREELSTPLIDIITRNYAAMVNKIKPII